MQSKHQLSILFTKSFVHQVLLTVASIDEQLSTLGELMYQPNQFQDNALAIGISCAHMHADPTCLTLFIKAWGDMHRRSYIANTPLLPSSRPDPTPRAQPRHPFRPLPLLQIHPPALMASTTFKFSEASIRSCISDAAPFDAFTSLFWCGIKCVGNTGLPPGPRRTLSSRGVGGGVLVGDRLVWAEKRGEGFHMYGPELTCVKLDHVFCYEAVFGKENGRPAHVVVTLPVEVMEAVCKDDEILKYGPKIMFKD